MKTEVDFEDFEYFEIWLKKWKFQYFQNFLALDWLERFLLVLNDYYHSEEDQFV